MRLHLCGERNADQSLEVFRQHIDGHQAKLGNQQLLALFNHVAAVQNRHDGRRIGTRTADALVLQLLNQRCFGEVSRRLGEVLLCGQQLVQHDFRIRLDIRNSLVLLLIGKFTCQLQPAGEFHD